MLPAMCTVCCFHGLCCCSYVTPRQSLCPLCACISGSSSVSNTTQACSLNSTLRQAFNWYCGPAGTCVNMLLYLFAGTSCACQAVTEFFKEFLAGKPFNYTATFKQGCSRREPGITPKNDISYTWKTLDELNTMCGLSRKWAGVHFQRSIDAGHKVCAGIGRKCFAKVKALWNGPDFPPGSAATATTAKTTLEESSAP